MPQRRRRRLRLGSVSTELLATSANSKKRFLWHTSRRHFAHATNERVRSHQPGQDIFKAIISEDIDWKPFPAFPPSERLAVVVGQSSQSGPYTIRVKVPRDVKLMPHTHPEDRIYTVISGVFYIGLGDQFDADKLQAYPPGAVIVLPAVQPTSTGPAPAGTSRK